VRALPIKLCLSLFLTKTDLNQLSALLKTLFVLRKHLFKPFFISLIEIMSVAGDYPVPM
jgi:hypothetical protein